MTLFSPAPAARQESILNWLGSTHYAELQKTIDILIDEQFSLIQESELKAPMDYLQRGEITKASHSHLSQAMRLRICSDVLSDILSKKITLKTNNHAQAATEARPDAS